MVGSWKLLRDSSLPLLLRMAGTPIRSSVDQRASGPECPPLAARKGKAADDHLWFVIVAICAQGACVRGREGDRSRTAADGLSQPFAGIPRSQPISQNAGSARWRLHVGGFECD